jgi:zinc protease
MRQKTTPLMNNKSASEWNSLPGPEDISRWELENGIVILTRSNFNSPSVVVSGYLNNGSIFDPDHQLGLANFACLSLLRGTEQFTFQKIYESLESVGSSMGFSASVHNTSFGGRALVEDLPRMLNVLVQALRYPTFPIEQIEKLRTQLLTGLAIRNQATSEVASLAYDKAVFNNHPYGRPEDGQPDTIQSISRQDIEDYHRAYYGPQGMVITIVGAVPAKEAFELVHAQLGDWENLEQVSPPEFPQLDRLKNVHREHIPIPGKVQTDLVMGVLGPHRNSEDFLPLSLGNNIFGQFGMMGRIGDIVRERAGLAYYASTSLSAWINAGSWEVSAGVNPENLQRAINLILQELNRFTEETVTVEELQDSQANYIGRLPLALESNFGVASALMNIERFQLGLDYYQRYPELVKEITAQQVLEVSRRYMDTSSLCIISAGPDEINSNDLS